MTNEEGKKKGSSAKSALEKRRLYKIFKNQDESAKTIGEGVRPKMWPSLSGRLNSL